MYREVRGKRRRVDRGRGEKDTREPHKRYSGSGGSGFSALLMTAARAPSQLRLRDAVSGQPVRDSQCQDSQR